ncbi:MAG: hypothetical protein K6D02_04055 [Lachnospiraceae bacterium]|nr:hypothetical protein [Lachnospiraceae bacterium]
MEKLLFISLGFYDYDDIIEYELVRAGYDVTRFCPIGNFNNQVPKRAANVITKGKYLFDLARKREEEFLLKNKTKYDVVFIIVGRHLDPEVMAKFRRRQKDARFICYLWDDVERVENFDKNKKFYDKILTFDRNDAEKYGYDFLPLFYTSFHRYEDEKKRYVLSMMGTFHSDRLEIWREIVESTRVNKRKTYLYLIPMKVPQIVKTLVPNKDEWYNRKNIRTKLQNFESMADKLKKSKTTLDVQFNSQNGLTLRTIESLAARTKLITTNENVKDYDFYEYGNIFVIDRDNPVVPQSFLRQEYNEVPKEIVEKYSLKNWVKEVLS